jgi:spore germination protein GerM
MTDDVPFDLLEPAPTTTTTSPSGVEVELFFMGSDGLLRPVLRRIQSSPTLDDLVAELDEPPSEAPDMRTALGEDLVIGVSLEGGIAQVDLGEDFTTLPLSDQVLALAQIVYTLTARPGVGRVSFQLEGSPIPIPRGDGVITTESVSRDAYANLLAPFI